MACMSMVYRVMAHYPSYGRCSYGLYGHGLSSYGPYSYDPYSYGLNSYGLNSYGTDESYGVAIGTRPPLGPLLGARFLPCHNYIGP